MIVVGIDPGPFETALVEQAQDGAILYFTKAKNEEVAARLSQILTRDAPGRRFVAIERVQSYGMTAGIEMFETAVWHGRYLERALSHGAECLRPFRKAITGHICHDAKAKDKNIRQALLDRYGLPGIKKKPGPTYGITKDVWAALAVSTWALDMIESGAVT